MVFLLLVDVWMILDEFVYFFGVLDNFMVMNFVQGIFVFVIGQVVLIGDMWVEILMVIMGICGIMFIVQILVVDGLICFFFIVDLNGDIGNY